MTLNQRRVAVIGAGVSGLLVVKQCLEEGMQPFCFEQHDQIGGTWYYTEELRPNQTAGSYKGLVSNVDTHFMNFSDFPAPVDAPIYFTREWYFEYLQSYVEHFDLAGHIQFNQTVIHVRQSQDHHQTGSWEVVVRDNNSGTEEVCVFDAVCLCSGALKKAQMPVLPGISDFKGKMLHAMDYRRPEVFNDLTVLVIGNQHSAGELAVSIQPHAKKVYLSVGDGTNVLTRFFAGKSTGLQVSRRSFLQSEKMIGEDIVAVSKLLLNHGEFGIGDGGNPVQGGGLMITDELPAYLHTGRINIVPKSIWYKNPKKIQEVDNKLGKYEVITLTSSWEKSLLNYVQIPPAGAAVARDKQKDFRLYKGVFPLSCEHPTLAVISAAPVFGSYLFSIDVTTRWAACVLAGKCNLPGHDVMREWVLTRQDYINTQCHGKNQMSSYSLGEEVAAELGVQPRFSRLLMRSPSLAYKVYFGPPHTCHFRLLGHGASEEAWKHSHKFYDYHFPSDGIGFLMKTMKMLVIGSLLAASAFYIKLNWEKLAFLGQ